MLEPNMFKSKGNEDYMNKLEEKKKRKSTFERIFIVSIGEKIEQSNFQIRKVIYIYIYHIF